MKILHVQGFTVKERIEKAQQIRRNLFESIRVSNKLINLIFYFIYN